MVGAFKITLRALKNLCITPNTSELVHGLVFSLLREHSPSLAERYHTAQQKPFTLSPIKARFIRDNGMLTLPSQHDFSFRMTTLSDEATRTFSLLFVNAHASKTKLKLGSSEARVIAVVPGNRAETTEFRIVEDIKVFPSEKNWTGKWWMEFCTPTAFKSGDTFVPLPEPGMLFAGIAKRWKEFVDATLPTYSADEFRKSVRIVRHQIRTKTFALSQGTIAGFVGRVLIR